MSRYWVNFARSGNPNGPGLPAWPAFTARNARVLYLDDDVRRDGVADLDALRVFDGVYTQVRGVPFGETAKVPH
jgi:para-nitrobenzyl esterase